MTMKCSEKITKDEPQEIIVCGDMCKDNQTITKMVKATTVPPIPHESKK